MVEPYEDLLRSGCGNPQEPTLGGGAMRMLCIVSIGGYDEGFDNNTATILRCEESIQTGIAFRGKKS